MNEDRTVTVVLDEPLRSTPKIQLSPKRPWSVVRLLDREIMSASLAALMALAALSAIGWSAPQAYANLGCDPTAGIPSTLLVSPDTVNVAVSGSGSATVTFNIAAADGTCAVTVSCSGSGLPTGASCPSSTIKPKLGATTVAVTLTIGTTSAFTGTYQIDLTASNPATGVSVTKTNAFTLNIWDFSLSASGAITAPVGGSGSNTITANLVGGVAQSITLSCSGLPAGATCSFNPSTITPSPSGTSSTLTITTTEGSTPTGRSIITVTGTFTSSGGSASTRTTTFTLNVWSFSLSAQGLAIKTAAGGAAGPIKITVSLTSGSPAGSAGAVSLSCSGLPTNATCIVGTVSGTPTFSSTVTISTSDSTPPGSYTITVTGTGGGVSRTISFTLNVWGFSLSAPPRIKVAQSGSASITINATLVPNSAGPQNVTLSCTGVPRGAACVFSSASGTPPFSPILTISTCLTPPGAYLIVVTGTGGGVSRTFPLDVSVTFTLPITTSSGSGTVTFSTDTGGLSGVAQAAAPASAAAFSTSSGLSFPLGFYTFTISSVPTGGSATVTVTLPTNLLPAGASMSNVVWVKCRSGTCITITPTARTSNSLTFVLTDGGPGDDDGTANGVITDPGAPGLPATPSITGATTSPMSIMAGQSVRICATITGAISSASATITKLTGVTVIVSLINEPGSNTWCGVYSSASSDTPGAYGVTISATDTGGNVVTGIGQPFTVTKVTTTATATTTTTTTTTAATTTSSPTTTPGATTGSTTTTSTQVQTVTITSTSLTTATQTLTSTAASPTTTTTATTAVIICLPIAATATTTATTATTGGTTSVSTGIQLVLPIPVFLGKA